MLSKIISIETVDYNEPVYNLEIKDNNNYFADNVLVHNCHRVGAAAFLKFVTRLNCRYRIGLSATPLRKDGRDRLSRAFLGNVVAKSNVVAKIPKIELVETGIMVKNQYRLWVYAMKFLSNNKLRNEMIVRDVFRDLRAGHHSIIIPLDFVKHGNDLMKMINRQAEINNAKRGEKWPIPMATFFTSSVKKSEEAMQKMLSDVDNGKFKVLIAIRSMIGEGVDLLRPTMLYNIVPCSANAIAGSPLFFQLSSRISTFHKDKQQPVVKLYIDGLGQSIGCFKSLFTQEIMKNLKSHPNRPPRYLIDESNYKRAMQILQQKEYFALNKPGDKITSKNIIESTPKKTGKGFSAFRG